MTNTPVTYAYRIVAAIIVAAVCVLAWLHFKPAPAPVGAPTIAAAAPQLGGVEQDDITPPKIKVYAPAAKKKLSLPPEVQTDPNQYVLGAAKLKNDTHPQTVTPVFDAASGETKIYVTRDPYPWIAAEQHGEVRLDYGYRNGFERYGLLSVSEDLVQIKAMHFGMTASLDSDGKAFAGLSAVYRW